METAINKIMKKIEEKKFRTSPWSYSYYLFEDGIDDFRISWGHKPDKSYRFSDHWNFSSNFERHCIIDGTDENYTINQLLLCQYDSTIEKYKIICDDLKVLVQISEALHKAEKEIKRDEYIFIIKTNENARKKVIDLLNKKEFYLNKTTDKFSYSKYGKLFQDFRALFPKTKISEKNKKSYVIIDDTDIAELKKIIAYERPTQEENMNEEINKSLEDENNNNSWNNWKKDKFNDFER